MQKLILISVLIFSLATKLYAENIELKNIAINYEDVDIRLVIKTLSETLNKNFIIDQDVRGKVTVVSPQKVTLTEAKQILEMILTINGYTIIEGETSAKILPITKARQVNTPVFEGKTIIPKSEQVITQLIYLEYSFVTTIAEIINPLISSYGALSIYEPTNLLIITDTASNISKLITIIKKVDSPKTELKKSHVIYLQNSNAEKTAQTLKQLYEKQSNKPHQNKQDPIIIADHHTNSLIIISYPQEFFVLESLIKQLDVAQPQVFVEILIAEITLGKTTQLGIELAANGGIIYGTTAGFAGTATNGITKNIATGGNLENNALGYIEGTNMIGNTIVPDIGALISLSQTDTDINILSVPQIVTSNNEEAKIIVGKKLAFIKNSQVTSDGGIVKTFEYKDVGIILSLIPSINEKGFVHFKIQQEIEDIVGTSFEGAIETNKREIVTNLTVKDKATAVIGGLVTETTRSNINKIPILGDIPLIGHLFKKTNKNKEKINLLVFITPHIIKSTEDFQQISTNQKQHSSHE